MVRNLGLWQAADRSGGAAGTGRRAQEIAAVAGRSQFANIFISIARCATGCQDKLGLPELPLLLPLPPSSGHMCVWHLRLCSGHWHRSHTYRQGQSLRSFGSEMQRSTAQTKRHLVAWSMLKSLGCRLTCSACSGLGFSLGSRVAWLWCLGLGLIH